MKYDKYRAYINTDKGFYLVDITNTLVDAIDKINSIGNGINYIIIGHDDEQDIDNFKMCWGRNDEGDKIIMSGHIEYHNGFPVWVDEETRFVTSYTSITTEISKDLKYYPSTTTTPIEYEPYKNIKYESLYVM